jgi:hypothetical protein
VDAARIASPELESSAWLAVSSQDRALAFSAVGVRWHGVSRSTAGWTNREIDYLEAEPSGRSRSKSFGLQSDRRHGIQAKSAKQAEPIDSLTQEA